MQQNEILLVYSEIRIFVKFFVQYLTTIFISSIKFHRIKITFCYVMHLAKPGDNHQ